MVHTSLVFHNFIRFKGHAATSSPWNWTVLPLNSMFWTQGVQHGSYHTTTNKLISLSIKESTLSFELELLWGNANTCDHFFPGEVCEEPHHWSSVQSLLFGGIISIEINRLTKVEKIFYGLLECHLSIVWKFIYLFHLHCDYNIIIRIKKNSNVYIKIAMFTLIRIKVHNKAVGKTRRELTNHTC